MSAAVAFADDDDPSRQTPTDAPQSMPPAASGDLLRQEPIVGPKPNTIAALDGYHLLRVYAESFADVQQIRIGFDNRARQADAQAMAPHSERLAAAEHQLKLAMARCYRSIVRPEVRAWQQTYRGLGEHLVARLLGHLGDPVIAQPFHWTATPHADHVCILGTCGSGRHLEALEPYERTLHQLWQYCGHGAPTKRVKGMSAEDAMGQGSPRCKMLVHLLAEACMKQIDRSSSQRAVDVQVSVAAGPVHSLDTGTDDQIRNDGHVQRVDPFRYRHIYDARRLITAERVHAAPCVRCGPSGKPAAEGSPWSKGHQQADALRIVGKEILRDLWLAARA